MKNGTDVDHLELVKRNHREIQARLEELNEEIVAVDENEQRRSLADDDPDNDDEFGVGGSIPTILDNYYHLAYIGDIYLGSTPNLKS